ncbi:MAG: hypothetical protein AAFQ59_05735 [Pseudomonadota bacterium]
MKLYGYANGDVSQKVLELDSVAICFESPEEARGFAKFAQSCAEDMRRSGDDYDHEHFAGGEVPDITIERLLDANR